MAIYYIDVLNDNNENTGCSEESPLKSEKDIALKPGDTVLFKRGSFMRDKIHTMSGTEEAHAILQRGENVGKVVLTV